MTMIYYCDNCGKYIIEEPESSHSFVKKVIENYDLLRSDEYHSSVMLTQEMLKGNRKSYQYTLNRDLYDYIQTCDFLYVTQEQMTKGNKSSDPFYRYCPFCGNYLTWKNPFIVDPRETPFHAFLVIVDILKGKRMKIIHSNIDTYQFRVEKNAREIENSIQISDIPTLKEEVDIKEYIYNLISVETSIYSLKKRYVELLMIDDDVQCAARYTINNLKEKIRENIPNKKDELKKEISRLEKYFNVDSITFNLEKYDFYKPKKPTKPKEPSISKPEKPIYLKPGLFNKFVIEKQNADLKLEYEENVAKYETAWEKYHKNMEKYNNQAQEYPNLLLQYEKNVELAKSKEKLNREKDVVTTARFNDLREELINIETNLNYVDETYEKELAKSLVVSTHNLCIQEIEMLEDSLKKAFEVRQKLHDLGIIHPKYLDFVCITSLYEYFDTGRCDSLTGPYGAYNLYENELKQNLIINKLDQVVSSLAKIQGNQYMLYMQLESINQQLNSISRKTNVVIHELNSIQKNTALSAYYTERTAYYSKVNAQLTKSLGFLIAMK